MSTSVSSSAKKPSGSLRKWVIILATLFFSLAVFFVIRTQGSVSGREFSPEHFQTREFGFYEIPFVHIQITPIRRKGVTIASNDYLRLNGLIKARSTPAVDEDWDLVWLSRGLSGSTPADANLLIQPMEMRGGSGSQYWKQWSIDHPKLAAILWPEVQKLATRELYVLVPTVLELAQQDFTAAQLSQKIDLLLREEYRTLVIDMREAGREDVAGQLLLEALADYPNDVKLRKLSTQQASADQTKTAS